MTINNLISLMIALAVALHVPMLRAQDGTEDAQKVAEEQAEAREAEQEAAEEQAEESMENTAEEETVDVPTVTIGNRVWRDLNGDGIQSEEEPGFEGVLIRAFSCDSEVLAIETTTDSEGMFAIEGQFPEGVYLEIEVPEGFAITSWNVGDNESSDSDADPLTGRSVCIELNCDDPAAECATMDLDIGLVSDETLAEFPGVAGAGFWKNHPKAWPVDQIEVGGIAYDANEAVTLISNGRDKSKTMFRSLVAAKLNTALGNDDACIAQTIDDADEWMAAHGPVGSDVPANSEAWKEGELLHDLLEDYNEGRACARKRDESRTPVSVSVGFSEHNGDSRDFRVRISSQPGRVFMLQKSEDLRNWEDVGVIENGFGITEAVQTEIDNNPNAFYRVVVVAGAAVEPSPEENSLGTFLQVENNEEIDLLPVVYQGDLVVRGNNNVIRGQVRDEDAFTVIAGDLEIRGNGNVLSNLTVLGRILLKGSNNELDSVDYQGEVDESEESAENDF